MSDNSKLYNEYINKAEHFKKKRLRKKYNDKANKVYAQMPLIEQMPIVQSIVGATFKRESLVVTKFLISINSIQ